MVDCRGLANIAKSTKGRFPSVCDPVAALRDAAPRFGADTDVAVVIDPQVYRQLHPGLLPKRV